jgi:hypothetical protein
MAEHWYYMQGGKECGPVPIERLRELLASGELKETDEVWKQGSPDWVPIRRVSTLSSGSAEARPGERAGPVLPAARPGLVTASPRGDPLTAYKLHRRAFRHFFAAGLLCCLFVVGAPVGILLFVFAFRARIEISHRGLAVRGLFGRRWLQRETVTRVGLYTSDRPDGLAGLGARDVWGGNAGIHLCWCDDYGQTRSVCVSMYEGQDEVLTRVFEMVNHLSVEELTMGLLGFRWP